MMCKDCVHFEVCANVYCEVTAETEIKNINGNGCYYFKDKLKYIELPCKVGDTAYRVVSTDYDAYPVGEYIIVPIIMRNVFQIVEMMKEREDWEKQTTPQIGWVYFTKSEAEQKLMELKNARYII